MKMARRLEMVVFGLMMSCVLMTSCASGNTPSTSGADEQLVKDAVAEFYSALNVMFTGDAAPMKAVWSHADDVIYMGPGGEMIQGWPAVLPEWEMQAAAKLGGEVQASDLHMTVGQDLAVATCWEKGQNVGADGNVEVVSIRATNVFRTEGGSWKMVGHHTDLLPFLAK
jgi:ketosteroid isomerase-like protein